MTFVAGSAYSPDWVLDAVSKLALEYGWSKSDILDQVYPAEVGPLLDAAYRRRAVLNLDALSIACAPYAEKEHRVKLFEQWNRIANPLPPKAEVFDPNQILRFGAAGIGVSPELMKDLRTMQESRKGNGRSTA
jgi:hypothetical protein